MDSIIKERLVNRSDKEDFRFVLFCSVCGSVWESTPIAKRGNMIQLTQAKQAAYEEAAEQFEICRLCVNPVCTKCQVTLGEMTVCSTCVKKMKM